MLPGIGSLGASYQKIAPSTGGNIYDSGESRRDIGGLVVNNSHPLMMLALGVAALGASYLVYLKVK